MAGLDKERLRPLPRTFYEDDVLRVARSLLGMLLVRELGSKLLVGRIVEVEAYRGSDDPASHAYRGMTERNKVMWAKPGTAYVYQIYGIHYCLNVVAEPEGMPAAVLIRALEPVMGIKVMRKNRGISNLRLLTSGPARLTKAMKIDKSFNWWDLTRGEVLYIAQGEPVPGSLVSRSKRVGVKDPRPWRLYVKGSPYVSRVRP